MDAAKYMGGLCASLLGLAVMAGPVQASPSFDALLVQAEKVRSADAAAFIRLLDQLNGRRAEATPLQREHLQYLNAYARAFAGSHDEAIRQARALATTSADPDMRYRAGALIVNSYASTRQFTEGLRQLEVTLDLVEKVSPEVRQFGLWSATVMYTQIGQHRLGLQYADKLLEQPVPDRTRCFASQIRLDAQQNLNELPASDTPLLAAIEDCTNQGERAAANFIRATLARKWAAQGRGEDAVALLREHLDEAKATRYPRLIGEIESLLAELLLARGEVAAAEAHARAAVGLRDSIANSLPLVVAYRTMYQVAERRGDLAAALEFHRLFAQADKNYLSDVNARELAYQIVHQETLQKSQQIELLNREKENLELQQRVNKQATQNVTLLAVLLGMLVAFIGYFAYKTKRMQVSFRKLAETDALTGISNRHHFTREAEEALAWCARTGEDVGLVMFDLDHFKQINDEYGHVTGDFVLRQVAQACRACCRRNDRLGRLGGEEFAILLIGCDLASATRMAQLCCEKIAAVETQGSGHRFHVSASFGVTTASLSGYDLTRMLSHADRMLYRSKHDGRNRVSVFADEPEAHGVQSVA